jgi:hypothetical protein
MEITEPVILDIRQGKRTVRLELKTRDDARDLIAAIARRMPDLPDDGAGLIEAVPVVPLPDAVEATVYCGARSQWGEACTLEEHWPPKPHVDTQDREWESETCPSCGFADGHNPAGCRRQDRLAALGEQVARLSQPDPERDDEDGPMDDAAELHRADEIRYHGMVPVHHGMLRFCALPPGHGFGCRDADGKMIFPEHGPLASVTPLHADDGQPAVRERIVDGETVERELCPHVHPETLEPCIGVLCHEPPCRNVEGDEWVPAGSAVTA